MPSYGANLPKKVRSTSASSNGPPTNNLGTRTDDATYPTAEDINPRARKRRRGDSRASINSIAAADDQELAELYSHGLPYNSGAAAVTLQSLTSPTASHAPNHIQGLNIVGMGANYDFSQPKMTVQIPRDPSPAKYEQDLGYGPYHAQYWSLVSGDLNAGTPLASNGGYQSPYGSIAPDSYYPPAQETQLAIPGDIQNGFTSGSDPLFTHSRQTSYASSMAMDPSNVYPSPVEHFGWGYPSVDPLLQHQSLPVLENLACQILSILLSSSVHDFVATVSEPDTGKGQAYAALEALFEQTKKHFARDALFIEPAGLSLNGSALSTIRKANLASFVITIFRGRDVPFLDLNAAFLDLFMPAGSRLFKNEGSLFLELKTQAYISVMLNTDLAKEDVLDQLFPRDLQLVILRRRSEPTHLAPTEQDFISRVNTRRQFLLTGSDDMDSLSQLPQKYNWGDFLEEIRMCVGTALELLDGKDTNANSFHPASSSPSDDPITKATLAAHAAISGQHASAFQNNGFHSPSTLHNPPFSTDLRHSHKRKRSSNSGGSGDSSSVSPSSPNASRMHLQYEQARASSHPKSTPPFNSRRVPGTPSTRRPWTQDEEKALMEGLERVKGPHWSQILAIYGAGGSISEVLKDRNQVQLKDKARNLKLFFLKSGIEVPVYLQRVTGELKTRAPAQAAKMEARERLKMLEDEKRGMRGD